MERHLSRGSPMKLGEDVKYAASGNGRRRTPLVAENPLGRWTADRIGPGRLFKSAAAWGAACDPPLNKNTVNNVMVTGHGDADTLVKMARAAGESPVAVLLLAGVLTEEDLRNHPPPGLALSPEEERVIAAIRALPPEYQSGASGLVREIGRFLRRPGQESGA